MEIAHNDHYARVSIVHRRAQNDQNKEGLLSLVQQLHAEQPALNIVALVHSFRQQRAFLAAGAGHALLKGCLDGRLRAAVVGVPANAVGSG